MKKLLLAFILIGITVTSLFAFNVEDLTKFPSCMDEKSWIINAGVGLPSFFDDINVPPIHVTVDRNIGIGDKKLPFFAGGFVGFSGYSSGRYSSSRYFSYSIPVGGRFGYHLNWGVKNLDTYGVATFGWIIGEIMPLVGVNFGVRYFVTNWFGFWAEAGYTTFSFLDLGVSFKF